MRIERKVKAITPEGGPGQPHGPGPRLVPMDPKHSSGIQVLPLVATRIPVVSDGSMGPGLGAQSPS